MDDISNQPTSPLPLAETPASESRVAASAIEAARERTIRVLTDRFADDTLSIEQFEARLDRMYKATTVAELDRLLQDLEAQPPRQAASPPYALSAAPRRLLAIMSNSERSGLWALPRQFLVRSLMSSVALDLREAALPHGVCEIDLLSVMSSLEILVPPGVVVEDLALGVMANVENRTLEDGFSRPDAPRIRITGTAVMANVEVRTAPPGLPFRAAWREARRAWRRSGR